MALEDKDVLSQAEAWELVGGRLVWEELKSHYPRLIVPLRVVGRKEQYLKEVVRTALRAAQMDGKLRDPDLRETSSK